MYSIYTFVLILLCIRHGGHEVSKYLQSELHSLFETVTPNLIPEAYQWIKSFGGYFRRFHGGALSEWVDNPNTSASFDLDARSTLAFLQVWLRISFLMTQLYLSLTKYHFRLTRTLQIQSSIGAEWVALLLSYFSTPWTTLPQPFSLHDE